MTARESKTFVCDEVFPGCPHKCSGESDTEVLVHTAGHLRADHSLREISPELLGKIRAAIHTKAAADS
jgi:predicted small metal-binding protein